MTSDDNRELPQNLENRDIGSGISIRRAQSAQYDEVGNVLFDAFSASGKVSPEYERRVRAIDERSASEEVWVASTRSGQIVGASLTPKPGHIEDGFFAFNTIGVLPQARGRGVGRSFVQHATDLAAYYGFDALLIHSGPDMKPAHRLYYHFGFRRRIDWETVVVDDGQRLLVLTYRIHQEV